MHLNDVVNILNYKLHNICSIIFKLQVHDNPYIKISRYKLYLVSHFIILQLFILFSNNVQPNGSTEVTFIYSYIYMRIQTA